MRVWSTTLIGLLALFACTSSSQRAGVGHPSQTHAAAPRRYVWLDTSCSDGEVDLAALGFERSVELRTTTDGGLVLTFDTALATTGCWSTSVWKAEPLAAGYRFVPEAWITQPADQPCGMEERKPVLGELEVSLDGLVIVTRQSPWCRGLDARFVYRAAGASATAQQLESPTRIAARYMAHFERGDAEALADLFSTEGSLVEPFSATEDQQPARHEGRAAIRSYFEHAFTSVQWHAVRVRSFETRADTVIADFEYMDAALAEPLRARNLLVLAGGEVFESEIQLVTDPKPTEPQTSASPSTPQP